MGGERALFQAIIRRAIVDAAYSGRSHELLRDKADARAWIVGRGFDFERACLFAGFDPDVLRERFMARKITGRHLEEARGRKPRLTPVVTLE